MIDKHQLPQKVLQDPEFFIAFGMGSGLMPIAPGTFGTLAAVPLYICLTYFSWIGYLTVVVIAFLAGVTICDRVSKKLGVHDHGGIVWDEWVGFWITMFLAPTGWQWVIVGFILFRFFDIVKLGFIRHIDRNVSGGLGIMLDDVFAGIIAWGCLQLIALGVNQWH